MIDGSIYTRKVKFYWAAKELCQNSTWAQRSIKKPRSSTSCWLFESSKVHLIFQLAWLSIAYSPLIVYFFLCGDPGERCRELIDWCDPCANGGTYMRSAGGFFCLCQSGYTGPHCSVPISCDASPCHHAAACLDFVSLLILPAPFLLHCS